VIPRAAFVRRAGARRWQAVGTTGEPHARRLTHAHAPERETPREHALPHDVYRHAHETPSARAAVVADVGAVSGPTLSYVTVRYDAGARKLTHTDDVSPRRVPSRTSFAQYLELAAHLVALNARVNPG
jgi:hypothetical protein